jgi:hypothetical protein
MTIHFDKARDTAGMETLAAGPSIHETIRKAVQCCSGEDGIVLSIDSAMALVEEWDGLMARLNQKGGY